MIKSWKDNNTLRRVRESEEAKTIVSTASLTLEPGKTINFTVSRVENGNPTGKEFEKELAHPEAGRDPKKSTPATNYVGVVLKALAYDEKSKAEESSLYYEVETSLSINGKKVSSQTERYDDMEDAVKAVSSDFRYPQGLGFEGIRSFHDILKSDWAAKGNNNESALERIPLDIRKTCKAECIAKWEYNKERKKAGEWRRGDPCDNVYLCSMSTGDQEHSGSCICRRLGLKEPHEWNV